MSHIKPDLLRTTHGYDQDACRLRHFLWFQKQSRSKEPLGWHTHAYVHARPTPSLDVQGAKRRRPDLSQTRKQQEF